MSHLKKKYPFENLADLVKINDSQKDFFQSFIKIVKIKPNAQDSIIKLDEITNNGNANIKFFLCFDLNEAIFIINKKDDMLPNDIVSQMQDNICKHYPYYGDSLRDILKRNYFNHIISDDDKIVWIIQILNALKDPKNREFLAHETISDTSFCVDSMKNLHLRTFSDFCLDDQSQIFSFNEHKSACVHLFEEICKEMSPEKKIYSNNGFCWYRNNHMIVDKILFKMQKKDGGYESFQEIIDDIKKTSIYLAKKKNIERRLEEAQANMNNKFTLTDMIIAQIEGLKDINRICALLFTKLRELAKGTDYYMLFNSILHIFFPSYNYNERKTDYIELLNCFKSNDIKTQISDLLNTFLPSNDVLDKISNSLIKEKILFDEKIDLSLIKSGLFELNDENKLNEIMRNIVNFYFPGVENKSINDYNIYDYFGILEFLANKDDLLYLVYPSISKEYLSDLEEMPSDEEIINFFKTFFSKDPFYSDFFVLSVIDGFDSLQISHQLYFNSFEASFYLERKYILHDLLGEEFTKKIKDQDEIFKNISNSKYIIHFNEEKNQMKYFANVSSVSFPFLSTSLYHLIWRNSKNKVITDADKILWAIQMAMAFRDLEIYQKENKSTDFSDSISDQSFLIDDMKNIYLCLLAFCNEREPDMSTTMGPFYYRSNNDKSYVYVYGVLLNEIITEMDPKTIFGNMSRYERIECMRNGYAKFDKFVQYGAEWYNKYGDDLKSIVFKCLYKEITFNQVIDELKETKLYLKNQYIVERREKEALPIDSSRRCSFRSIMISEITGVNDMSNVLSSFFENINERLEEYECKALGKDIIEDLENGKSPDCFFKAINCFSVNNQSDFI